MFAGKGCFSCSAGSETDIQVGMFKMANCTLAAFATQETDTLPLLLVSKLSWDPPHIPYDAAQSNAPRHTGTTLWRQI
jgi:hypothetical protein